MTPLSSETLDSLARVTTATITSQLFKRGIRNAYIRGPKAVNPAEARMVGEAYTLRFIPLREDLADATVLNDPSYPQRKAVEAAPPGSVLAIDCRGLADTGVLGDILATRLRVRGVAGVVADGAVRDLAEFATIGMPVFCLGGAAPQSLTSHFAADVQCPIACGGTAIIPGDVIAADGDGAVVIPRQLAAEVARDGLEQELLEQFVKSRIEAGAAIPGTYPPNVETIAAFQAWRKSRE